MDNATVRASNINKTGSRIVNIGENQVLVYYNLKHLLQYFGSLAVLCNVTCCRTALENVVLAHVQVHSCVSALVKRMLTKIF